MKSPMQKSSYGYAMTRKPLLAQIVAFGVLLVTLMRFASAAGMPTPAAPSFNAKSYALLDVQSGQFIATKDPDEHIEPASLTKLMTIYIVFDELAHNKIHMGDKVPVSVKAWKTGGSRMFIQPGKPVTVKQLLHGVITDSGNDATVALAEYIGGTAGTFATYMNQMAAQLGMKDSHFVNPDGLPKPKHYSSAHDLAVLTRAIIRDFPQYYKLFSQKEFTYNGIHQYNRNRLLWLDSSVDGLKTGHTEHAGYCLVASAQRDGMRLVSVVTGTPSGNARTQDSEALLNYGFRFYKTKRVFAADKPLQKVRVWKGAQSQVPVGVMKPIYITAPRESFKDLSTQAQVHAQLMAPVAKHQKLGALQVELNGKILKQAPVYALQAVPEGGWWTQLSDTVRLWIHNR